MAMRSAFVNPLPPAVELEDEDERTAAERKRMIRGSNNSGGSVEDLGISSGMVRILALAVVFPSSAWRSTAAAWHDTASSLGAPFGWAPLGDFPVRARASRPPSETFSSSSSSSSSPAGAMVEMSII